MTNHPQNLVNLYRAFYRADSDYRPSAKKCVQPLYDACEIICRSDSALRSPEMLIDLISGHTAKLMQQIHGEHGALGRWVIADLAAERQAIIEFATYLVQEVFYGSFNGDLARFIGKQRGYLENACEYLYRMAQDAENAARKQVEV